jgi:hypothetical protein
VARVLDDTGLVGDVLPKDANKQVYPAELHSKLLKVGFRVIDSYAQPSPNYFNTKGDKELLLIALGGKSKIHDHKLAPHLIEAFATASELWVSSLDFDDPLLLLRQLHAVALNRKSSILEVLADELLGICRTVKAYGKITEVQPFNWASAPKASEKLRRNRLAAERDIRARLRLLEGVCLIIAHFRELMTSECVDAAQSGARQATSAFFLLCVLSGEGEVRNFARKSLEFQTVASTALGCKIELIGSELKSEFYHLVQYFANNLAETMQLITRFWRLNPEEYALAQEEALEDFYVFHASVTELT